MCGFLCVVSRSGKALRIEKSILSHRGPDASHEIYTDYISLRHWRLSIQDLSKNSDQPLTNGKYTLAYNGEIYDFKRLAASMYGVEASSDTQLVLRVLENQDFEKIRYASGFYSLIFLNRNDSTIFGARDAFGKKPLYYYFSNNFFICGSEELAVRRLVSGCKLNSDINKTALLHYLRFKDLHFGETFFEGIEELPPGTTFNFDQPAWRLSLDKSWATYYESSPFYKELDTKKSIHHIEYSKNIKNSLFLSIQKRFVSDVPLQLALSGGVDSSLVAAVSPTSMGSSIFNRALTISSEIRPSEASKAKKLCKDLELDHRVINISKIDWLSEIKEAIQINGGPLSHPHSIALNIICGEAAHVGKVLVTGEGADELFKGYRHYSEAGSEGFAFREHVKLEDFFLTEESTVGKYFEDFEISLKKIKSLTYNDNRDLDIKTHLLSLLRRNDKFSMTNSVELRSAFLDPYLFSLIVNLQSRTGDLYSKSWLVGVLQNIYPKYDVDAEKIGFYVPFDEWWNEYYPCSTLEKYITIFKNYFQSVFNLVLRDDVKIEGKLAWEVLNIGIFLSVYDKNS